MFNKKGAAEKFPVRPGNEKREGDNSFAPSGKVGRVSVYPISPVGAVYG
jgi:hypothetical protein